MKKLFCLILLAGLVLSLYAKGSVEKKIDIYYTSSLNGNLDGCDCKGNPRSGLVKRAVYLRKLNHNSTLLLETGDIFDVYEDKLLSDYILESYADLDYDIIAIGDQEFSNDNNYLLRNKKTELLRSDNLSIKNNSGIYEQLSNKPLIKSINGITIAVLSIIDPEVFRFYPDNIINSFKIENPEDAIQKLLKNSDVADSDIQIVLFHGTLKRAKELAGSSALLDIIIAGHEQQIINKEIANDTILVSPGGEGNLLGHLEILYKDKKLFFQNNFISFDYNIDPDDKNIRNRINNYNQIMKGKIKN